MTKRKIEEREGMMHETVSCPLVLVRKHETIGFWDKTSCHRQKNLDTAVCKAVWEDYFCGAVHTIEGRM